MLYEKMFNVMNDSDAIEKSMTVGTGKNAYKAVSEAAILNMIKPLFKKYKLIIFPISGDINELVTVYNKTDYDGKTTENQRAITQLKVMYRIVDIETSEFQDVVGFGNGADSQDKGAGKSFTYSLKNALSKSFMLFSGEDADNTHSDDINPPNEVPMVGDKTDADLRKELENAIISLEKNAALAGFSVASVIAKYNKDEVKDIKTIEEMPVKKIVGYDQMMLISIKKKEQNKKKQEGAK